MPCLKCGKLTTVFHPCPSWPATIDEAMERIAVLGTMAGHERAVATRAIGREKAAEKERDILVRKLESARSALAEVLSRFEPCGEGWSTTMMTPDAELARWREEGGL